MTVPREVLEGRFYLVTRRCVQRQFLLRPDDDLNNAFLYCLIEAAQRFNIDVLMTVAMSNHHHTAIYDPDGRLCEFMQRFHGMVAKCVNVLRGRQENCWSIEPPCAVRLTEGCDVMDKVVYAATNPVKDGLVERVTDWPGVNSFSALMADEVLRASRPDFFFRDEGPMPETVELRQVIPAVLGDRDRFVAELGERVAGYELSRGRWRLANDRTVLGRTRVLRQSWLASPTSNEPRRGLRPRLAARWLWARVETLLRTRAFLDAYRSARAALVAGVRVPFPPGTYWLRRFAGVEIASPSRN